MKNYIIILLIAFVFWSEAGLSQTQTDSLFTVYNQLPDDTSKIIKLLNYSLSKSNEGDIKSAIEILNECVNISKRINNIYFEAASIENLSYIQYNYVKSITLLNEALELYRKCNNTNKVCYIYMCLADAYYKQGNYMLALDYNKQLYTEAVKSNNKQMEAYSYDILANIYLDQKLFDKAIENCKKSITIKKELKVPGDIEYSYYHTAAIYIEMNEFEKAIELLDLAEITSAKINYYDNLADTYLAKGIVFSKLNKPDSAVAYYLKGKEFANKKNLGKQVMLANLYLGEYYLKTGNFKKADILLDSSYSFADKFKSNKYKLQTVLGLKESAVKQNNFKKAYEFTEMERVIRDCTYIDESKRQTLQMELQIKHDAEQKMKDAEIKRQKSIQKYTYLFIAFLVIFIMVVLYGYRIKRRDNRELKRQKKLIEDSNEELQQQKDEILKQNEELETQRGLLAEQNKKITDSILYAQRIQNAMLTPAILPEQIFSDYFIFFRPRDIVSGDFYWIREIQNNIIVVVADCTGHGVPGAFMSMLGMAFLNEIVINRLITRPDLVLNEMRKYIKNALHQTGKDGEAKDGMDIIFCTINNQNSTLMYAGANNPLYRVRNNELLEIKADRMPVGVYINERESFTNHCLDILPDDIFYLSTDGFEDQLGGPSGKKFMSKNFKALLLQHHSKSFNQQLKILEQTIDNWHDKKNQQLDDMLIIGFKPTIK